MMTSLRIPVWDDKSIRFAVLSESVQLTQAPYVQIKGNVTSETFERAHECMSNVLYLHVDWSATKESVFPLLEKASMPNLRALRIDVQLEDHVALAVVDVLRSKPQLEQIRLQLQQTSGRATLNMFEALSSLPLTALSFVFWMGESRQTIDRFCMLLQQKRDTLVSLEVETLANDESLGRGLVSNGLHGLHHLRLLRMRGLSLDDVPIQNLCKAMESMPHLATLRISANDITAWLKFFSSSFRPITAFEFSGHVADSLFTELLHALKRNTRLRTLKLSGDRFHVKCVLESGLADEGFLTRVIDFYTDKNICSYESLLKRNKARHTACKLACVALISVRQKRGVLKWIAPHVIRMISMLLWDTRNQSVWDAEEPVAREEQRDKRSKK